MYQVLFVIHLMVTAGLIGIILVQRPSGDGMGLSGSSSNSFMSGRTAANLVTRTTAILATLFILTSLTLGWISSHNHVSTDKSIMDNIDGSAPATVPAPAKQEPAKPAIPRPE